MNKIELKNITVLPIFLLFTLQLAHPILTALKGTENEWLMELLKAFNTGDIKK